MTATSRTAKSPVGRDPAKDRDSGASRSCGKGDLRDGWVPRCTDLGHRRAGRHFAGSFYHYFESKEEVFREVAAEVEPRLREPL